MSFSAYATMQGFDGRLGVPPKFFRWAAPLLLVLALPVAVVAFGVLLAVAAVIATVGFAARMLRRRRAARADGSVIEVDYTVVDDGHGRRGQRSGRGRIGG